MNEVKETKSKREIILETIQAGGATMDSLTKAADCKYASVMSAFSMLRLMGHYPVKDVPVEVEGQEEPVLTYRIVDAAEMEEIKAAQAEKAAAKKTTKPKDPAARLAAANKRVERCDKADATAKARAAKAKDDRELELRSQKSGIELELAQIEQEKAQAAYDAAVEAGDIELEPEPEPIEEVTDTEETFAD